jgi:hypothetical protein
MPSLSAPFKIGTGSVSSLLKSASTLQREIATYQDDSAKITYENSGHTDEAYNTYVTYLQGRIKTLSAAGTITDMTKAQNMQQEVVTATHSNISYQIQQENIQLMSQGDAGTVAGYQMKMRVLGDQLSRAMAIGDQTLAFTLESQYYSTSQSLNTAIAAANSATTTLAKANQTADATYQGDIVKNLQGALSNLNAQVKGMSIQDMNGIVQQMVNDPTFQGQLQALGVTIDSSTQPNYFDIVNGIQGAIYNHTLLESAAKSPYDPQGAQDLQFTAQNMIDGTTKIATIAGSLSAQELQQAAQDPAMFTYDNATGNFNRTAAIGYHYQADVNGRNVLVPTYSGETADARNKTFFLTPQQTQFMTNLGLNFSMNKSGTTGDGVQVQATDATPAWLRGIMGNNGMTQMFTGGNGQLVFRAPASTGEGFSSYVLANDGSGKYGVLEQTADGAIINAGGNYGFNSAAAINNLTNLAIAAQSTLKVTQPTTPSLTANAQRYTQTLKVAQAVQTTPIKVTAPTLTIPQVSTANPQTTANPQQTTPARATQPATANPQGTAGANLNTSGGGGIPLGNL